ncbi:MAG TPA: chromosome segregation protein SMC [Anaerolineae bacterium]|nr:chromosome segregation protein SMC [Anaerolineae bacterium]
MRLKQLRLQGYKTFASKTEFLFDDGITAIVGPNGSGKSNIADALRWVLGEQSYQTLRGKRSTDMIFSGSQARSRSGMAQAILTLDNSDGWLPIDYSEVEVGRRIYRSGDSEYLLNGQKVRLKDITNLLATSGLAERTYTIIGQGLIDQALSLRSEERRALFEEAAGISHYKTRRKEALNRLQETQRNLERIHDILSEIRPRLNSLKRQASRAENYQQLLEDLRGLLRIWYGYQWEKAKDDFRLYRQQAQDHQSGWEAHRQLLLTQQDKINELQHQIQARQESLSQTQNKRDNLREEYEVARRQVAIFQERRDAIQQQIKDITAELPTLEENSTAARQELDTALTDLQQAQQDASAQQTAFAQFEAGYQAQQQKIKAAQNKLSQADHNRQQAQRQYAQAAGQLTQLRERLEEAQGVTGPTTELAALEKEKAKFEAGLEPLQTAVTTHQQARQTLSQQRSDLIRNLKQGRRQQGDLTRQLRQMEQEASRREARCDLLNQMRHKNDKFPRKVPLLERLNRWITLAEPYQTSLASALSWHLSLAILPDQQALWTLHKRYQADQPLTALALDQLPPAPPPLNIDQLCHTADVPTTAILGPATQFVTPQPDAPPAIQNLLGHLLNLTLLVQDHRHAYQLSRHLPPGGLVITPDNFYATAGGFVTFAPPNPSADLLAKEKEWQTAVADLNQYQTELASQQSAAQQAQDELDKYQTEIDKLNNDERRLYQKEQTASQNLSQHQRQLDRINQQINFYHKQIADQEKQQARLQQRITDAETQYKALETEITTAENAYTVAQTELADLPVGESEQQRQNWTQQLNATKTIVAGRQAVVDSRRATLRQAENLLNRRRERLTTLQQELAQIDLDQVQIRQNDLERQINTLTATIEPIKKEITAKQKQLNENQVVLEREQKHGHQLENYYTQARIKLTQQESYIEGLRDRIKADLGLVALNYDEDQTGQAPLPLAEIVEQLPLVDELPADIEEAIQNGRGQLQRMGAINPDAPAEYQETLERYEFMTQQIEDLNTTEAHLRQIIGELDILTSEAFGATVDEVNTHFTAMFTQLFGGGSAKLVLTDPDDLTISGVDIIAQLPNRRQQGLGLLSGGERSLTACALIFSLLKVAPPPFCVMDEVDAMLDEANVNRFRDALIELGQHTQFIVITHNRGTVRAAQTIYGISMNTDSTSQILSLKPDEYLTQEEIS